MMNRSEVDNLHLKDSFRQADIPGKIAIILSIWFGAGLFPGVPGTVGTLATLPLVLGMGYLGIWVRALVLVIALAVAIWASGRCEELLNRSDPSEIVIDEVAGFLLTMFLLPLSWLNLVLGFVLFRFFDILKPFPIRLFEQLRGGLGIVMDDLMAGIYAYLAVRMILFLVF